MLTIYGNETIGYLNTIRIGGKCPHCNQNSRFSIRSTPIDKELNNENSIEVIISYSCDACQKAIPIYWEIYDYDTNKSILVENPKMILPVLEKFDFDHVPQEISKEVIEALNCLSVNAFNGFAAITRRTVQAICDNLGVKGASKVQKQIDELLELTGLEEEWNDLAKQILLTGHDGAHPHLPEVNQERATILLSLLQDLTYQLYTRPGKVKAAAELRQKVIDKKD